jgi:hypothetical protein
MTRIGNSQQEADVNFVRDRFPEGGLLFESSRREDLAKYLETGK